MEKKKIKFRKFISILMIISICLMIAGIGA